MRPLRSGTMPSRYRCEHRERALQEIAEVVGEIAVVALRDLLFGVREVAAERRLAQQKVAHRVGAEALGERERIDGIAEALAHLLAVDGDPAVREDELGRRFAERPQDRRPDDRVKARDLLADELRLRRPISRESASRPRSSRSP